MTQPITRNDTEWREAANAYRQAKHALQDAQQAEQEAKLTLLEMAETDTRGAGVAVSYIERKGPIDYKALLAHVAPGFNVEPYRKRSTSVATIKIAD